MKRGRRRPPPPGSAQSRRAPSLFFSSALPPAPLSLSPYLAHARHGLEDQLLDETGRLVRFLGGLAQGNEADGQVGQAGRQAAPRHLRREKRGGREGARAMEGGWQRARMRVCGRAGACLCSRRAGERRAVSAEGKVNSFASSSLLGVTEKKTPPRSPSPHFFVSLRAHCTPSYTVARAHHGHRPGARHPTRDP